MIKQSNTINHAERERAIAIIHLLQKATQGMMQPASPIIVERFGQDPFLVLISCILSLRTRDTVSLPASCRLFEVARTPQEMLTLPLPSLEKLIFPVVYFRVKAKTIQAISSMLIDQFGGIVPQSEEELLSLPGVGRKTMNLVRAQGFGIPAICVDVHVHRISNRLGLVKTKTPEETEWALRALLPEGYWSTYNTLIVMWGQNMCVPLSPWCSRCVLAPLCPRIGVTKSR